MSTIAVSGGFDPLHNGHLEFFKAAKACADRLLVIVETDEWLEKKHRPVLCQQSRMKLIRELRMVDFVVGCRTDCSLILEELRPELYGVGPTYTDHSKLPEYKVCQDNNIRIITLMHSDSAIHSSQILAEAAKPKYINPPVTVSALILGDAGGLLLQRRKESGGEGLVELPGGFLEPGETLEQACEREVIEELGVRVKAHQYFMSIVDKYPDGRDIISVYFLCKKYGQIVEFDGWWTSGLNPDAKFFSECDRKAVEKFFSK